MSKQTRNPDGRHAQRLSRCARILPSIALSAALAEKVERLRVERGETLAALVRRLIAEAQEPKA